MLFSIVAVMSVILFLISISIFYFYRAYTLDFIMLLLIQGSLGAIQYVVFIYFKWLGESKKASILSAIGYGIGVCTGVIFMYVFENTLMCFLAGIVAGNIIGVLINMIVARSYIDFSFNKSLIPEAKSLLKLSIPFFYNSLLVQSYKAIDRFMILFFLNQEILGVYSLIIRVCQIPLMGGEVVLGAFQAITFLNHKTKEAKKLYNKILGVNFILVNIIIVLFTITLYFLSPIIEGLAVIEDYIYLVPLILTNVAFISLKTYGGFSYFIHSKTKYIAYITFVSLVLYVSLAYLLSGFGILGFSFSAALISIISTCFFYFLSSKIESFGEKIPRIFLLSTSSMLISIALTIILYYYK